MNRYLLVYGELLHGGIQTLIVRLANHLVRKGQPVAVCVPGGGLADKLLPGVDRLHWARRKEAVGKSAAWIAGSAEPVTLISFDPISAAIGLSIEAAANAGTPIIHLSGVYHPRSFFMTGERRDRILLNRLVAKAVGDPFIFYMNAECRMDHERRWGADLQSSRIIPLPIEMRPAQWRGSGSGPLKIVSVGRLVDFKAYNLAAAEIAAECRQRGIGLQWDIYGAGPLDPEIRRAIDRHHVGDTVRLMGELPYDRFEEAIAGYDLFVGMGTAALEAAMIGVPTIVATEGEARRTYGFVDALPFGNVGERQSSPPPHDLGEQIQAYSALHRAERIRIGEQCRNAVLPYSNEHCVEALDDLAAHVNSPPRMAFKKAVATLYGGLTDSNLASVARRLKSIARR